VHRVAGDAAQLERQFRHRIFLVIVHWFSFVKQVYALQGATCHTNARHVNAALKLVRVGMLFNLTIRFCYRFLNSGTYPTSRFQRCAAENEALVDLD
jgi:hypothetical protein